MTANLRILVTGVRGQLGFELERSLQGLGTIIAADRSVMDLQNLDGVRQAIRQHAPQLIVNPAAYTAVDAAESHVDTARRVNAEAPAVLAEEAKRLGAALIHFSTDYVFDGTKPTPYDESDAAAPANVYGLTKFEGEQTIAASGCLHVIARTSWVYGYRSKSFLSTMLHLAQKGAPLRIVADQVGAPTWTVTLATMTAHIVAQGLAGGTYDEGWWRERSGLYHLTGGGSTSWAGFAEKIFASLPEERRVSVTPIATSEYPTPARRPANSRLSGEKAADVFGVRAPDWEESLRLCLAEARMSAAYAGLFGLV